jgi:hypothetical protein
VTTAKVRNSRSPDRILLLERAIRAVRGDDPLRPVAVLVPNALQGLWLGRHGVADTGPRRERLPLRQTDRPSANGQRRSDSRASSVGRGRPRIGDNRARRRPQAQGADVAFTSPTPQVGAALDPIASPTPVVGAAICLRRPSPDDLRFARAHESAIFARTLARFALYEPVLLARFDAFLESRP